MIKPVVLASLLSGAVLIAPSAPAFADAVSDGLARAKTSLAVYAAKPVFVAPGEPFDAKACAKGKKMLSIPNSSANPFLKGIIDRQKAAGAEVGLEVKEWENQGQSSQWAPRDRSPDQFRTAAPAIPSSPPAAPTAIPLHRNRGRAGSLERPALSGPPASQPAA
jgi:hypothetical protein